MLAADQYPAVLEFEDDTAEYVEAFAISRGAVVVDGNHAAVLAFENVQQIGSESSASLAAIAAELGEDRVTAFAL